MKKTLRRVLGAVVLVGAWSCVASASTISYYVDVFSALTTAQLCPGGTCPAGSTSTLGTGGGPNVTLTIPQFNQNGNVDEGTPSANHIFSLTSVALTLDWQATGNVTVYNFYSANIPFDNAQAATLMTLTAGGTQVVGNGVAATGPQTAVCCNVLNNNPVGFYLGSTNFAGLTGSGSNSQLAALLSSFEGYGNNTFSANVATNAVQVSGSSLDAHATSLAYQGSGQMGAIMSITYNYTETAIPEPGTMALMGSSLIGLAVLIRKRITNR